MSQTFKELKDENKKLIRDRKDQDTFIIKVNNDLQLANAKNQQLIAIAKQLDNELTITKKLLKLHL